MADDTSSTEGIFTPDSAVEDKYQMLGASVLSKVTNGHIYVQMMNVTNDRIIIKEDTCIGSFEWLGVSNNDECDDMNDEICDNHYDTRHCKRVNSTFKIPIDTKCKEVNFEDVHIGNDVTVSQQREFVAMLPNQER